MIHFKSILTLLVCSMHIAALAQLEHDIKIPDKNNSKICASCLDAIAKKPKEIQFGIQRDNFNNIYFITNNKTWFDQIFSSSYDGIAVDIVSKSRYDCSIPKIENNSYFKGSIQTPQYYKKFKKSIQITPEGYVIVPLGTIPMEFTHQDIECNLVILKNKHVCYYNAFFDLQSYKWDLLDMGFYTDSLTYKKDIIASESKENQYITNTKVLKFEIPFEKNTSKYEQSDIKPLYDSLRLTDFTIKKISIRAYSSVEGSEERNMHLQQERAASIVQAMQTFQTESIEKEILATENWVDFFNDLTGTPFAYILSLSKSEIKDLLQKKDIASQLEPTLAQHRKAIIILELEKRNHYKNLSDNQLIEIFESNAKQNNIQKAIDIQNEILRRVSYLESPKDLINAIEIPQQSSFSVLHNKKIMFKYLMNEQDVYATYKELLELNNLIPNNAFIAYNICVFTFKVWILGKQHIDPVLFKKQILELRKLSISEHLIKRMLINFEIIQSELYMQKGEYANKDKSLQYIYSTYKQVNHSDIDLLNLAQYFASYAKYDWAVKLLEPRVKRRDVHEDLLFYYLNLTLVDEKITKLASYRTIMLNAIQTNQSRFCDIFEPYGQGGVTFQLLENEYLRKTYCENCE